MGSQTLLVVENISDEDVDEMFEEEEDEKAMDVQTLIKKSYANVSSDNKNGHHKRQSTRLLLDSLRPSHQQQQQDKEKEAEEEEQKHITWGMILIELDNFDHLLSITAFDRAELIEIIQNLIDESLVYENQYVDHMME